MFKGKITFTAVRNTEAEVLEAILFDIHEEFRREGASITIEEIEESS